MLMDLRIGEDANVRIGVDGMIDVDGKADVSMDPCGPYLYGRIVADQCIAYETEKKANGGVPKNDLAIYPAYDTDTTFKAAAVQGLRTLGGQPYFYNGYEWVIETPIGPLWCSVREGVIFTRWEDTDEAYRQLRECNPYSGKWNFYAPGGRKGATKEAAEKIIRAIGVEIGRLQRKVEGERKWEGEVRS
jgi:hypothetical protein